MSSKPERKETVFNGFARRLWPQYGRDVARSGLLENRRETVERGFFPGNAADLPFKNIPIKSAACPQLIVSALFDELSGVEDQNQVGMLHGREPLRDDEAGPSFTQSPNRFLQTQAFPVARRISGTRIYTALVF